MKKHLHMCVFCFSFPPFFQERSEDRPRHTSHGSIRTCCRDSVAIHCWTLVFCLECGWNSFPYETTEQANYEHVCRLHSVWLLKFSARGQTQNGFEKTRQGGYRLSGEGLSVKCFFLMESLFLQFPGLRTIL